MDEQGLWKDILESKYRSWRNLNGYFKKQYASLWWKDLSEVSGEGQEGRWFDQNIE